MAPQELDMAVHDETSLSTEETSLLTEASTLIGEDDEIKILGEIVGGHQLTRDDAFSGNEDFNGIQPYCIVKLGHEIIHKTKAAAEPGDNPVWTVSTKSLFLFSVTPRDLAQNDLHISVWFKRKDPLKLTTLETCFLGRANLNCSTLISHCNEQRFEVELHDEDVFKELGSRGSLTLRFRLATEQDEEFLGIFKTNPELLKYTSTRNLNAITQQSQRGQPSKIPAMPLVTEADEGQVAGASFVNAISCAFTVKTKFCKKSGERKKLVKPFPDPDRIADTTYMTAREIKLETHAPSKKWIKAGSGTLGRLYLEILSCKDLPNVDVGEAVGNVTDCFVCAVFEDAMVQTPVIDDELNPHWLPWTQRAFEFGIMHPASMLYLGAFDYDLGISLHEPVGRVAVNISNFQRDTDYTLCYNLYASSNVTERTASGSLTIRIRVEYDDEKEVLLAALRPRPKFHINVQKEKSLPVVRYTCFGEYGDEDQPFDLTVARSYVNELFEYKSAISYCVGDAMKSLIFWRGQVKVFGFLLPIHSLLFFWAGTTLVERPQLAPPFFLLSIAWIMLATQTLRNQHPSPWNRCPSFWYYVDVLRNGKSTLSVRQINPLEGSKEAEAYEKKWQDRLEKDLKEAATRAAMQREINQMGDENIHTKLEAGIPLDLMQRLTRYQGIIARYCRYFRFIKIIVTWEESFVSFWITACFLAAGLVALLLPWSFILLWTGRIIVWGLLGPHMKVVDILLRSTFRDDEALEKAVENFKKQSKFARHRRQDAIKLKDMKCLAFGKYITLVPSYNLSRHYDRPLYSSFARLHHGSPEKIEFAPYCVPGQQFFGTMVPRTETEHFRHLAELPRLDKLLAAVELCLKAIKETGDYEELKRLEGQASLEEDLPDSVGFELISFDGKEQLDDKETSLKITAAPNLLLNTALGYAILRDEEIKSIGRRKSSIAVSGFEILEKEESARREKSMQLAKTSKVIIDHQMKLAVLQTDAAFTSKRHSFYKQEEYDPIKDLSKGLPSDLFDDTEEETGIEIVLCEAEKQSDENENLIRPSASTDSCVLFYCE